MRLAAIGRGDFLGHLLPCQFRQGVRCGDLHLIVDRRRPHIQRPPEDEREAEHIVDLVRIVRAAGGDDRVRARRLGVGRRDLRVRIGHGEDDRLRGHVLHHFGLQRAGGGEAEKGIGALQRFLQRARVRLRRMGGLPLVQPFAALVDHALAVAEDDIVVRHAHRLDQLGAGDGSGAGAIDHQFDVLELAAGQVAGVDQAGSADDRRTMLIVMHDRDLHPLAQGLLDDEAFRRGDVLQVDAAEARLHQCHRLDELVGILGVELDVDRIDVGEALEEHRLAFHHRLRGERTEIAEAEYRSAVGDHRDQIALCGIVIGFRRILGDGAYGHRDARRISEAEVALRRHRLGGDDLDLARPAHGMEFQRLGLREFDVAAFAHLLSPFSAFAVGLHW